jgi:hypothetical protein
MVGEGMIEMDWLLMLGCWVSLFIRIFLLARRCHDGPVVGFIGIFALLGWAWLTERYTSVMIHEGDIKISIEAWAGLMTLALREVAILTAHGKKVEL